MNIKIETVDTDLLAEHEAELQETSFDHLLNLDEGFMDNKLSKAAAQSSED